MAQAYIDKSMFRIRLWFWTKIISGIGTGLAGLFAAINYFWPNEVREVKDRFFVEGRKGSQQQQQQSH